MERAREARSSDFRMWLFVADAPKVTCQSCGAFRG